MAFITCPNCGKRTSDRVKRCIYCNRGHDAGKESSVGREKHHVQTRKGLNGLLGLCLLGLVFYLYSVREAGFLYTDSASMLPTINPGDRMFVIGLDNELPARGSIINFRFEENGAVRYIKRVAGLPGDVIEIKDGRLYLNGEPAPEPYLFEELMHFNFNEATVPAGSLFVLGDNRNNSFDSTEWGFLPAEDVLGKVVLVYWPVFRLLY